MSRQQTKEQERAKYAWECVDEVQDSLSEKTGSEYGQLARGLPALIQTNGLGQAMAYLLSKGKNDLTKPHRRLYSHISRWVTKELGWGENDKLMEELVRRSSADYRRATSETMALSVWLRRFAEARLVKEENDATATQST